MTVLQIDGVANVRDVGGIPTPAGPIRTGVLFRSGHLAGATETGASALRERVRHIVDLRADDEVLAQPTAVSDVPIARMPLFFGSVASFFEQDSSLDDLYRHILEDGADKLVGTIGLVASQESTLVHCTVGKDRTGVTIAVALSAVGAEREAVIADYALTESQLPPARTRRVVEYLQAQHPEAKNLVALATQSPAPVMRGLLASIDEEFGSAAGYLRAHGMSAADLTDLRRTLVGPNG